MRGQPKNSRHGAADASGGRSQHGAGRQRSSAQPREHHPDNRESNVENPALTWATSRPSGSWVKVFNLRGIPFYRHTHTGETQWEVPENDVTAERTWEMFVEGAGSAAKLCFLNCHTGKPGPFLSPMTATDQQGARQSAAEFLADMQGSAQQMVPAPTQWRHSGASRSHSADGVAGGTDLDESDGASYGDDGEASPTGSVSSSALASAASSPARMARNASEFVAKSVSKMEQSFSDFVQLAKRWGHTIQEATRSYETAVRVSTALGPGLAFKPRQRPKSLVGPRATADSEGSGDRKWTVYLEDGRRVSLAFGDLKFGAGLDVANATSGAGSAPELAAAAAASASASRGERGTVRPARPRAGSTSSTGTDNGHGSRGRSRSRHNSGSRVRVQTAFGEGVILAQRNGGLYDVLIDSKGTVTIPKSQLQFGGGEKFDPARVQSHPSNTSASTKAGIFDKLVGSIDSVLDPIAQRSLDAEELSSESEDSGYEDYEDSRDARISGRHATRHRAKPKVPSLNLASVVSMDNTEDDEMFRPPANRRSRR